MNFQSSAVPSSTLYFQKSSDIAKIWEKIKKNLVQLRSTHYLLHEFSKTIKLKFRIGTYTRPITNSILVKIHGSDNVIIFWDKWNMTSL